jgi:hypothetical protein
LVEHATENRGVAGSIPALGTTFRHKRNLYAVRYNQSIAGVAQLVEHLLAKEKVTSSSLVARSGKQAKACFYLSKVRKASSV